MVGQRIIDSFEASDLSIIYQVPRRQLEMDIAQQYRQALTRVIGQDGAVDMFGIQPWDKDPAQLVARWLIVGETEGWVDSEAARMKSALRQIGTGKLWTLGADGSRQWCWAKQTGRPQTPVGWDKPFWLPVQATWQALCDPMASAQVTGSVTITGSGQTFTITNPGNAVIEGTGGIVFRLRANTSGGIVTPQISSSTTGQTCGSSTGSASVNSELKWDFEQWQFQYSNNDGSTYSTDWANTTIPVTQRKGGIVLLPASANAPGGVNTFVYTGGGSPSLNIDYAFWPKYEI